MLLPMLAVYVLTFSGIVAKSFAVKTPTMYHGGSLTARKLSCSSSDGGNIATGVQVTAWG